MNYLSHPKYKICKREWMPQYLMQSSSNSMKELYWLVYKKSSELIHIYYEDSNTKLRAVTA